MSRFYGSIEGERCKTPATRRGFNGIRGHIRGWDIGCEVVMTVDKEGNDRCEVYRTDGSNGPGIKQLIAAWSVGEDVTTGKG